MKYKLNLLNENELNNKGFTLIEILVALAISSVIMMAMVTFMVTGTKSYDTTETEVQMQTESQSTLNLMSNVVMSANDVSCGVVTTASPASPTPSVAPTVTPAASPDPSASVAPTASSTDPESVDYVVVKETNSDIDNTYYHYYVLQNHKLYYKKFGPYTSTDTVKTVEQCYTEINSNLKKCLMAENLADGGLKIKINKDDVGKIRNVFVSLDFAIKNRTYNVKNTIRPRNVN